MCKKKNKLKNHSCYYFFFTLVANAQVANQPADLLACDDEGDKIAIFDLTVNESQTLGSQDPNIYRCSYHETLEDSEENVSEIVSKTVY